MVRSYTVSMDAFDLFKKLGSGAKFDLKRFAKDAERFKVGFDAKCIIKLTYSGLLFYKTEEIREFQFEMLPHG